MQTLKALLVVFKVAEMESINKWVSGKWMNGLYFEQKEEEKPNFEGEERSDFPTAPIGRVHDPVTQSTGQGHRSGCWGMPQLARLGLATFSGTLAEWINEHNQVLLGIQNHKAWAPDSG